MNSTTTSDFRVVEFKSPGSTARLDICEVFYTHGQPYDFRPASPVAPTVAHLRATLTNMTAALDRPVLRYNLETHSFTPVVEETYP